MATRTHFSGGYRTGLRQKTLKRAIPCRGVGLHSGATVSMLLRPAEADSGIRFLRTDVVVRRVGDTDPPALTIFSGPGGCWVVDASDEPLRAEPLDADAVRARLGDALAGVRAELEVLRG